MRGATQSRCGYFLFPPFPPFQSTRPVRGATEKVKGGALRGIVSIHAPRVGRDRYFAEFAMSGVSIHAPRVGRDLSLFMSIAHRARFNPRAPCGARLYGTPSSSRRSVFQSTRPVWGATRGGIRRYVLFVVSIHAPRVGRDFSPPFFYVVIVVSIHAPRVGRDRTIKRRHQLHESFNPRAPCGARLRRGSTDRDAWEFQSTRPVRGATCPVLHVRILLHVSIHAPRAGRDCLSFFIHFLFLVSIHAPRAGRDGKRSYDFPLLPHIYGYYSPQI